MRENRKPHNLQEVMLMSENDPSLCESWILLLCYGPGLNEPGVTTRGSSGIRTTVTMEDVGSAEFPHKWCKFPTHPCLWFLTGVQTVKQDSCLREGWGQEQHCESRRGMSSGEQVSETWFCSSLGGWEPELIQGLKTMNVTVWHEQ